MICLIILRSKCYIKCCTYFPYSLLFITYPAKFPVCFFLILLKNFNFVTQSVVFFLYAPEFLLLFFCPVFSLRLFFRCLGDDFGLGSCLASVPRLPIIAWRTASVPSLCFPMTFAELSSLLAMHSNGERANASPRMSKSGTQKIVDCQLYKVFPVKWKSFIY